MSQAKTLLEAWNRAYLQVRERIEQSGRDQRWEFDRRPLFDQTNCMAQRCGDLREVTIVLEQFHSIFGQELKAVTGESHHINEVLKRVDALVLPFQQTPVDVWNKNESQITWDQLMSRFREQVGQIEEMAKQFIDRSFMKLRSAEGAFDLLANIGTIGSRESINSQLMSKWGEILNQFNQELDQVAAIFDEHQAAPPLEKNQPPVAGAIRWSRSLFYRIRQTVIRFGTLPEMLSSEHGRVATKNYLTLAKRMREYERVLHADWCRSVDSLAISCMKSHILILESQVLAATHAASPESGAMANGQSVDGFHVLIAQGESKAVESAANAAATLAALKDDGDANRNNVFHENAEYEKLLVNFRAEMHHITKEAKYLEPMGFAVPESALNLALQQEKFYVLVENLEEMLAQYHDVLANLEASERKLLAGHIAALKRTIKPGVTRLNWNSLGIQEFTKRCLVEIGKFSSMVNQIRKNSSTIQQTVEQIARTHLFKRANAASRSKSIETTKRITGTGDAPLVAAAATGDPDARCLSALSPSPLSLALARSPATRPSRRYQRRPAPLLRSLPEQVARRDRVA
ncbi:hypothetical protein CAUPRSCDRAFT_12174 [Caulochytrium protostelioides]|uniref:Dynein heavy chain tail domain-containing protein n=1 Tax=Caulochytrium protostelioides TaxID=1555241 RepID=A0A4P9WSJ2_9FUNG|nr:hypothetical protein CAUPRSCDRAFT_12174 [Caulochytrium protostelioides]